MTAAETAPARHGGEYLQTGDVRTYYEVHGTGEPLVLLQGGLCTVETLDGLTPCSRSGSVSTPERRGHGRTADVDGPITFRGMADDTAAFWTGSGSRARRWSASATAPRSPRTSHSAAPIWSAGWC